ncbi:hypothetical protein WR25_18360 [Diploscapter pachys]|uniref:Uncharacterized protein n=1 Tax=Diploscapter pachys TaxID=2018661 RepID=A0A2A2JZ65_9BILA|nr:hypothetical protein WR25_18360 [Diploscapter pachys]
MHTSVERNDKLMSCSSRSALNAFDRRSGCFEVRPPTLGVKSLDESTCSSGYASQDVSPDSSMHLPSWHSSSPRSGSWKSGTDEGFYGLYADETPSLYDNIAAEEHVYHELMRSYSSELLPSCSEEASRSPTPLYDRIASPVYATPWTNYPLIQKSDCDFEQRQRPRPLIVRNKNWQQPNIVYAQPYRGPMIQPHVAERQFEQPNSYFNRKMRDMEVVDMRMKEEKKATMAVPEDVDSNEEAENENANGDVCEEFLTALDEQINELQIRSEELRTLVEKARIRRREWLHPQLECTFELAI